MKNKILYQILTLLLFTTCFYTKLEAQSIDVEAKLEQSSIRIGDQTYLHLIVHQPVNSKVTFPQLTDKLVPNIEIVKVGKKETTINKAKPNTITIQKEYLITSFEAGNYKIPSFVFVSGNDSLKTNELYFNVTTVKVDTTKGIYDIKKPIVVKYTFADLLKDSLQEYWIWILSLVILLLLIIGVIWYLRKRKNRVEPVQKPIISTTPPHIEALNSFKVLKEKKLWQQGDFKSFHSELTDILREYLEKRYQIKTHEKTTDEIITSLKRLDITEDNKTLLNQILVLADLVKFAKEKPLPGENELSIENAIVFVLQTQKVEILEPLKGENHHG